MSYCQKIRLQQTLSFDNFSVHLPFIFFPCLLDQSPTYDERHHPPTLYNYIILVSQQTIYRRMRPKSAKPGARVSDYDEQSRDSHDNQPIVREQIKTESQKNKNRMLSATQQRRFLNIAKPVELSNGEFTRIMPKNIYQDKQRLYSQAMQLKQNMHGILDENMKLKTKIAVLEKEKDKLSRIYEQDVGTKAYNTNNPAMDNSMVNKLKKMLRDAHQDNRLLGAELKKLKKSVKYTKISELEIENKTLIEESTRLNRIIEELMMEREQQAEERNRSDQLEAFLKQKLQQNENLISTNQRLADKIIDLEETQKANQSRVAERQKKLLKDLDIAKRKLVDSKRQSQYLGSQINKLREEKNRPVPQAPINRSKVPVKPDSKLLEEIENLKKKNAELQKKLTENQQNQPPLKQQSKEPAPVKPSSTPLKGQSGAKIVNSSAVASSGVPLVVEFKSKASENQQSQPQQQNPPPAAQPTSQVSPAVAAGSKQPKQAQKPKPNKQATEYSEQQFDEEDQSKVSKPASPNEQKPASDAPKSPTQKKGEQQSVKFEEYKQDFAAEDDDKHEQKVIYKKEDKKTPPKKKKGTKPKSSGKKKELSAISALLTVRMKAQRYPFEELKQDIKESGQANFRLQEMYSMLGNSPFFLTEQQSRHVLQYFFDNENPDATSTIVVDKLIQKLRKLIKDFDLLEEEEEEQMDLRIAEMVTTYANELQAAFQQKKNGPDTISKADLQELFGQLQLQSAYVDLIIGRLSLVSDDLEHLNYYEFFREFYEGDDMDVQEVDEQYEPSNSRTLNKHQMIQEEQLEESQESKRSKKEGKKKPRKAAYELE